jgi:uncharacterized protein YbbC (DUF1343 family)
VCNPASVDHRLIHISDRLAAHTATHLAAIFGPQHGFRSDVQENMIETGHAVDARRRVPVYSLYSETREPTPDMLRDLDVLVVDLQDVGTRIYTYIYTMAYCLKAARRHGVKVIVCDRPNPIGGVEIEGSLLGAPYTSFVGQFPIPTRHGMTPGELAQLFNNHFNIGCELEVVTMDGWRRDLWQDETDAPWVLPSPNMPTIDAATVFPGTVHFEGTQMSEGRGTTRPFELIGAPYVDPDAYADRLNALGLKGVYFRACVFQPVFQKHGGVSCGGVQIHVLDRDIFEPVSTGVAMVKAAYEMYPEQFRWKEPPYEYVYDKNPFDVISGTDTIRRSFEQGVDLGTLVASWEEPLQQFLKTREAFLLY